MTTKVIIECPGPNHQNVLVEQYNPTTGISSNSIYRLAEGEKVELYVHTNNALRITEVAKALWLEDEN